MRPESHVVGDVGQAAVALIFKSWGWTASVVQSDYGEDLACQVFVDQQRTPFYFRCQVKSFGDASKRSKKRLDGAFSVKLSSKLCGEWLLAFYPVLLVVYDCKNGAGYWVDATNALRSRITGPSARTITLNVPCENLLSIGRDAIAAKLSQYYAKLFRIESEGVERKVLPMLMPRYRALSPFDQFGRPAQTNAKLMTVEFAPTHRENLPSWTASVQSLDPQRLYGLVYKAQHTDMASYSERLSQMLAEASSEVQLASDEWLAFICDPLRYSVSEVDASVMSFQRELSDWTSYAYVKGHLVHDHQYAFETPDGFVRQIGRRARSWDGYYCVSLSNDLAVQLLAGCRTSPVDGARSASLRDHARAQYLPWRCPSTGVDELCELLQGAELVFRRVETESCVVGSDWVLGAICTPMFAPDLGLVPQAFSWSELENGSVAHKLAAAGLTSRLPGEPGDHILTERLAQMTSCIAVDPPSQWLVDRVSARPGLPLDLLDRRLIVQRMRAAQPNPDAEARLRRLEQDLRQIALTGSEIATSITHVDSFQGRVVVATVEWSPLLAESSASSLERAIPAISVAFDDVLPQATNECCGLGTSIDVLRLLGELYFEGDRLM